MLKKMAELKILNKDNEKRESLVNSERFFWLISSLAVSFASEEMKKYCDIYLKDFPVCEEYIRSNEIVGIFKRSIVDGDVSEDDFSFLKKYLLDDLELLSGFGCDYASEYSPVKGFVIGKTFSTYWLTYKLTELEFQEVLGEEEKNNIYMILDGVIADHNELEEIEKALPGGIDEDNKLYLESHWRNGSCFWQESYKDLVLLAGGITSYRGGNQ